MEVGFEGFMVIPTHFFGTFAAITILMIFVALSFFYYFYVDKSMLVIVSLLYMVFAIIKMSVRAIQTLPGVFAPVEVNYLDQLLAINNVLFSCCLFFFVLYITQTNKQIVRVSIVIFAVIAIVACIIIPNPEWLPVFFSIPFNGVGLFLILHKQKKVHPRIEYLIIGIFATVLYFPLTIIADAYFLKWRSYEWIIVMLLAFSILIFFMQRYKKIINEKVLLYSQLGVDSLTGVYTKEFLLDTIRDMQDVYVLFMDINRFKQINDRYGHLVGDQLLQRFGRILQLLSTHQMICGRYGGDEFALILEKSTKETAIQIAKGLIVSFREILQALGLDQQDQAVGLSVGITYAPGQMDTSALGKADWAMYRAKASGNDRVVVAEDEVLA